MLLLDDGQIVLGASPETALYQRPMEFNQRRYGHTWSAECHPGANHRIQHPVRHNNDHARSGLDVNHRPARPPFSVVPPHGTAMKWMPAVVNDHIRPDMGRMAGRLPSAAKTGSSPAPTTADAPPQPATP